MLALTSNGMSNAKQYYNVHSEEYAGKWDLSEAGLEKPANHYRLEIIRAMIEMASIKPGDRVVEIGCGTGLVLKELLKITKPVYGTDISAEMLGRAKKYLGNEQSNVILMENDILKLSLEKDYFDKIISMEVLRYINDVPKALRNVRNIMKEDAVFVFTMTNFFSFSLFPIKYYLRKLFRAKKEEELIHYFATEGSIKRMIRESGLKVASFRKLNLLSFNPLVQKIVRSRSQAKNIMAMDRVLAKIPLVNRLFDTLIFAVKLDK